MKMASFNSNSQYARNSASHSRGESLHSLNSLRE